jgi:hypothetical protein
MIDRQLFQAATEPTGMTEGIGMMSRILALMVPAAVFFAALYFIVYLWLAASR